jgi:hypothetical protein
MKGNNQGNRTNKLYRMLWAYLYVKVHGSLDVKTYQQTFGLSQKAVWRDVLKAGNEFEQVSTMLDSTLPDVGAVLSQMIQLDSLTKLPVVRLPQARFSYSTVNVIVDHKTKRVSYLPFNQDTYDSAGNKVAEVGFAGGDLTTESQLS